MTQSATVLAVKVKDLNNFQNVQMSNGETQLPHLVFQLPHPHSVHVSTHNESTILKNYKHKHLFMLSKHERAKTGRVTIKMRGFELDCFVF